MTKPARKKSPANKPAQRKAKSWVEWRMALKAADRPYCIADRTREAAKFRVSHETLNPNEWHVIKTRVTVIG